MTKEEMVQLILTAIQSDEVLLRAIRLSASQAISAMSEDQLGSIISALQLGE